MEHPGARALTEGALSIGTTRAVELDDDLLAFTLVISTLTALAFGLIPALQAGSAEPQAILGRQSRGGTADRAQQRLRGALVVAEVALAVVLIVGAGLLLRTFSSLVSVDLGFRPAQTITMRLFLGVRDADYRVRLVDEILQRDEDVPGVEAAGTIQFLPLAGMTCGSGFWLADQPTVDPHGLTTRVLAREPRLFRAPSAFRCCRAARSMPGHGIGCDGWQSSIARSPDAISRRPVSVVTSVCMRPNRPPSEIVGVVGDIRHGGLTTEPAPTVYLLHAQNPGYITTLVVRTAGEPASLAGSIKAAIRDADLRRRCRT